MGWEEGGETDIRSPPLRLFFLLWDNQSGEGLGGKTLFLTSLIIFHEERISRVNR
jgi:hypothetical protein